MALFDALFGGSSENTPEVDPLTVTAAPRTPADNGLRLANGPPMVRQEDLLPGIGNIDPGTPQIAERPRLNYNNSMDASAVNSANLDNGAPSGGMANPGIYGLLPKSLQHGTLRNMLGALGDAFLVGSGHQAQYEPRMQRQEIGQAMAGYDPNDPDKAMAAIQRIAATGAAGSPEIADQLQKNYNDVQLRKQLMEQNMNYKQATIQARNDNLFNRMNPVAQADLAQAKDAADYKARLQRWNTRLKAIDPNTDAVTAFGVPEEYSPGAVGAQAGMTNQQITQHGDRQSQQATSRRNTDVRAGATIQAAGIGASSRDRATDKPTSSTILQGLIAKKNSGVALTDAEQATFDHMTQVAKRGRSLPANLTVQPQGGGQRPIPTAADIAYARAHPEAQAAFRAHFNRNP